MGFEDVLVSNLEEYKKKCLHRERRTTIAYLGLDLIINKEGRIHCIEINGEHSGSSGLTNKKGENVIRKRFINYLASFGLPVEVIANNFCFERDKATYAWAETIGVRTTPLESFQLECSKRAMGNDSMSDEEYFGRRRNLSPVALSGLNSRFKKYFFQRTRETGFKQDSGIYDLRQAKGIIWNSNHKFLPIDEDNYLVVNPRIVQWVLGDKASQHQMMRLMSTFYCKNVEEVPENEFLRKYIRRNSTEKIVLKPTEGKGGNGVVVLETRLLRNFPTLLDHPEEYLDDDRCKELAELKDSYGVIVNPLIESKPYYSPLTRKHHRACIRYLVAVHSENGNMHPYPLGGFARLSSEPISDKLYSYVANTFKGAHSIPLTAREESRIKRWIDPLVRKFYRRSLRLDLGLDPIINAVWAFEHPKLYESPWLLYR